MNYLKKFLRRIPLRIANLRAREWATLGALCLIVLVIGALFHPHVQKRLVLKYVAPSVQQLRFDHLHILPWSVHITDLKVRVFGGEFAVDRLLLHFSTPSLLVRTITVNELRLSGGRFDLRGFTPPKSTSKGPFPGVFSSLDTGFDFELPKAELDAVVQLSEHQRVELNLHGGDIGPNVLGVLNFTGKFETGTNDSVKFDGDIELDQLTRGHFKSILVGMRAHATSPLLPQPEHLSIVAAITPTSNPPWQEFETTDGGTYFEPLPDKVQLTLEQQDVDKNVRAVVGVNALYDGRTGTFSGEYTLNSNDRVAKPYLGELTLPRFNQSASGVLSINLERLAGEITMDGRINFTELHRILGVDPNVPTELSLLQHIGLSFTPDNAVIEKMAIQLQDEDSQTVLSSALPQPFTVELANPAAALSHAQTLLQLDFGGILLAWFNAMLPDYEIVSGSINGNFEVSNDEQGKLVIAPRQSIELNDIRVEHGGLPLIENAKIQLTPRFEHSADQTTLDIPDFTILVDDAVLATAQIQGRSPTNENDSASIHIKLSGDVYIDPVFAQPAVKDYFSTLSLPKSLSLHFESALVQQEDRIRFDHLKAELLHPEKEKLLELQSKQPLTLFISGSGQQIKSADSGIATIGIRNIDLAWLNTFVTPYALDGTLKRANFTLHTAADGKYGLTPDTPLEISALNVSDGESRLIDNLWLSIQPKIEYAADATQITYDALRISAGKQHLIGGNGSVSLTHGDNTATTIGAAGQLRVTLNNIATQPVIAAALPTDNFTTPISTDVQYQLSHANAVTKIDSLDLRLLHNKTSFIDITTTHGVTLKQTLGPEESLAQHAVGEVELRIDDLSAAILADVLPSGTLDFDTINGVLRLSSDGERLSASAVEPLVVKTVRLIDADRNPLLHPFDIKSAGSVTAIGQSFDVAMEELSVNFRNASTTALGGKFTATIEPDHQIPLRRLHAEFNGVLPQLLNQPIALPDHALTSGRLSTTITVDPNGNISADTKLNQLASSEPLSIHTIEMPLLGNMRDDGKGFDFKMPLIGTGTSGISNASAIGEYVPVPGQPASLHVQILSELFYLNDILATITGITSNKETPDTIDDSAQDSVLIDEKPDSSAFWDVLPYSTQVDFEFKQVFYSDYVAFNGINGQIDIDDKTLALNGFSAHFHESPITFDGGLSFDANEDASDPYTAEFVGKIQDFDLNQFFTELTPTQTSRIEGLFGVDVAVAGSSPNAAEFRNRLLLDLKMTSRDGLFRPLPPDSALMVGATDTLGIIGEGLSYIPTGGFGAGAISRLVNYIAEIEYDSVEVRIKRDTSLDLAIERFDMLSPNIRMAASGSIKHIPGKDIIDSPLDVVANLNMVGKGAAILYSMDLLEQEQDRFGYWKGPEFKVWGSAAATESNLAEIIQRAGDGTVKGGLTRPISGLIGNLKYRWFGNDAEVAAAKREIESTDAAEETSTD